MAGCLPMHFPVVVAAFTAMLQEPFLLHGAIASTSGCAVLIVVNGPIREELGMSGTFSVLGSGNRANTVIGRAVRLTLINLLDFRPGKGDRATLGNPGKISFCLAEDEENSPWESLAEERGMPKEASAVTVMATMAPRQIMNEWTTVPEEILDTFIAEMKANMRHYSIYPGNYVIIVPPQLRVHFANAGWSKQDIQRYVFEKARVRRGDWADCGKGAIVGSKAETEFTALVDPEPPADRCRRRSGWGIRCRDSAPARREEQGGHDRRRRLPRLRPGLSFNFGGPVSATFILEAKMGC